MSRLRWMANIAVVGCLALAACSSRPAPRIISGDGDYRGSQTRSQLPQRRDCPRPGLLNMPVRSGVMFYRWENQYIQVSVLADGTVSGALPGVQLTGTHDGSTITGNVTDGLCGLHFTLRKVGG